MIILFIHYFSSLFSIISLHFLIYNIHMSYIYTQTQVQVQVQDPDCIDNRPNHSDIALFNSNGNGNNIQRAIYYITTTEGMLSHFVQLEKLWNIANSVNRTIIAAPFQSYHYPSVKTIKLCDIFVLPSNLTCTNEKAYSIGKRFNCTLISSNPEHYGLDPLTKTITKFYYKDISCIAGLIDIHHTKGYHPSYIFQEYPIIFQSKYKVLLKLAKEYLGIKPGIEYAVVHWRRGDQLTKRCKHSTSSDTETELVHDHEHESKHNKPSKAIIHQSRQLKVTLDTTLNCGTVDEFISGTEDIKNRMCSNPKKTLTFIATNEKDPKILKSLKRQRYLLLSDIQSKLVLNKKINEMDEFIIELMLMCDANYFFGWGRSFANNIVKRCRSEHGSHYITHINQTGNS